MSEDPSSPLLGAQSSKARSPSHQSRRSSGSRVSHQSEDAVESTPLLAHGADGHDYGNLPNHDESQSPAASWLRHVQGRSSSKGQTRRWPTIIALTVLAAFILTILGLGFAAPAVVEEYAKEAMVFEPRGLSIESFTSSGLRARIQGDFALDGSRVRRKPVRDLGRAGTWIAKAVESKESEVKVYLPRYGNMLLGTAIVPPLEVSVRDGDTTHLDFVCELYAGDLDSLRTMVEEWIAGRVGSLDVRGIANVPLKSGVFNLGTQTLSQSIIFAGDQIPILPQYDITKLNFHEIDFPNRDTGMAVDVILNVTNKYPISFTVPPLGFEILVQGCSPTQPYIHLADAVVEELDIGFQQDVSAHVRGLIQKLPGPVVSACPQTQKSPLDVLLGDYIRGDDATVYVRGSDPPSEKTPSWITDIIRSVTVPVPFPGKTLGDLIRSFSLTNVHFGLPDPFAGPKTPESHPRISAIVKALASLPTEMNFPLSVTRVRAQAEVFYKKDKLGNLNLKEWQSANSTQVEAHGDIDASLAVESVVNNAPLEITNEDVLAEVVQAMLFGGRPVVLGVKANVDVETQTALGKFVVRDIPAKGKFSVKR